jgi:hypothetical protein
MEQQNLSSGKKRGDNTQKAQLA